MQFEKEVIAESSNSRWNNYISYTFQWKPVAVTQLDISDLIAPIAGQHPDTIVDIGMENDQLCSATVVWYEYFGDGEYGAPVMEDETFRENVTYRAEITIRPKKNSQNADICTFSVKPSAVSLNGEAPTEVLAGSRAVYIYQDCIAEIKKNSTVHGMVASTGSADDTVVVQLIPAGMSEVAYETEVNGNNTPYSFSGVPFGAYTMRVSKSGHLTKNISITVSSENVIVNVTLEKIPEGGDILLGDINADGVVNGKDSNLLARAVMGLLEYKEGSYEFTAADLDFDGSISAKDSNLIQRIVRGMLKL